MDDVRTISLPARESHDTSRPGPETPQDGEPAPTREARSRGLLVVTAIMVSLTVGVILGQTVAYEDSSVYAATRTEPVDAGYRTPSATLPGARATVPMSASHDRVLEVSGDAALLIVRSVDLGDRLLDVSTLDGSAVPKIASRDGGPRLDLMQTGVPGRVGADIQLNSRVRWTLRLTGRAAEQDVDMSGGRLAGIELTGGAARVVLRLPNPRGTIPVALTGTASELDVQASVPVRVRLRKGAGGTVIDAQARHAVKPGTILTSTGWRNTANRYLITAPARVNLLRVSAAPQPPLPGPQRPAR
jgi:hypothetical protein